MNDGSATPPRHMYAVGRLYNPKRRKWPEAAQLRLSETGCELVMFYNSPTAAEIRTVKNGVASFAWITRPHIGLLCYRFGTEQWSEAPFQAHRQTDLQPGITPVPDGVSLLVDVVLVDATDGVIRVLRSASWPAAFATVVRDAISAQLSAPYDAAAARRELADLQTIPTDMLAHEHATARC